MPRQLDSHVASHLRSAAVPITRRWVELLVERLGVRPERVLPTQSLLNHIPAVLSQVADFLQDPADGPLDTMVRKDLALLADLRRRQGFTLREILEEFAILSELVEETLTEAADSYPHQIERADLIRLVGRLKDAVYLLGSETAARFRTWSARQHEERVRLLEGYTAMLSHELGNRLGAAETAVRLIVESGAQLPPERLERLHELILRSVKSGLETVQGVRALFHPHGADGAQSIRALPLGSVIRDAVHQMRVPAAERGIELHLSHAGPEEPIDAERFPLVFFNLVTNAIRHHDAPDGAGHVVIDVEEDADGWAVIVRDDGPGIPPELSDRVFEPMVRSSQGDGAGLGLAIAREAVEQMGGTIAFEAAPERGTVFRFTVPRQSTVG